MAKTEDIEAKLAAYVDGELDEAQRAEIEAHLASNPAHKQLIIELMQQRQLVRDLPREAAPAEVTDAINAQLERAVLLGDVDDGIEAAARMRIGFWPQVRAMAAVLFLTVGLAAVIWKLLPSPNHPPPQFSDTRALPGPAIEVSRDDRGAESAKAEGMTESAAKPLASAAPASIAPKKDSTDLAERSTFDTSRQRLQDENKSKLAADLPLGGAGGGGGAFKGGATGLPGERELDRQLVVSNANEPSKEMFAKVLEERMKLVNANASAGNPVVYVIPTDNLTATNREVTDYLTLNGIKWEANTEPMPQQLELAPQQRAYASRNQSQTVQAKGGYGYSGAPAPGQAATQSPAPQGAQQSQAQPQEKAGESLQRQAQGERGMQQPSRQAAEQEQQQEPQQQRNAQFGQQLAGAAGDNFLTQGRGEQLIVARQVTRQQAIELCVGLDGLRERNLGDKRQNAQTVANAPAAQEALAPAVGFNTFERGAEAPTTPLATANEDLRKQNVTAAKDADAEAIPGNVGPADRLEAGAGLKQLTEAPAPQGAAPATMPSTQPGQENRDRLDQLGGGLVATLPDSNASPGAAGALAEGNDLKRANTTAGDGLIRATGQLEDKGGAGALALDAATTQPAAMDDAERVDLVIVVCSEPPATQPVPPPAAVQPPPDPAP